MKSQISRKEERRSRWSAAAFGPSGRCIEVFEYCGRLVSVKQELWYNIINFGVHLELLWENVDNDDETAVDAMDR